MTNSDKKWMGPVSFIPLIAITIWWFYIMYVTGHIIKHEEFQQHEKVVTMIAQNFGGSGTLFMIAFLIGLAVLVAFIVHLKKVRTMNGASKLAWMAFMIVFGPLAFPVYYLVEVRHEPDDVPMYSSLEDGMG